MAAIHPTEDEKLKVGKRPLGVAFRLLEAISDRIRVISELQIVFAYQAPSDRGARR